MHKHIFFFLMFAYWFKTIIFKSLSCSWCHKSKDKRMNLDLSRNFICAWGFQSSCSIEDRSLGCEPGREEGSRDPLQAAGSVRPASYTPAPLARVFLVLDSDQLNSRDPQMLLLKSYLKRKSDIISLGHRDWNWSGLCARQPNHFSVARGSLCREDLELATLAPGSAPSCRLFDSISLALWWITCRK